MRIEIQKSQDYTFTWSFYDYNIQDIPSSGTITVYKPGGQTLVSETSVTINTAGDISYTLAAANTGTIDYNYKIELEYVVGSTTYRPFYLFDIVETPLQNTVRDEDLFQYVEQLRDKNTPFVKETTSDGTSTTLISTELIPLNLNFKGGDVEIYIDDTTTHRAEVTDWSSTTGTITFSPQYIPVGTSEASTIEQSKRFRIRASYQRFINEAYNEQVSRDIRNRIGLKARFIDSTVTRNLTIFKALEIICFSKIEEDGDVWSVRYKGFAQKYKDEYAKLSEPVDYNDDGEISDRENKSRPSYLNKALSR